MTSQRARYLSHPSLGGQRQIAFFKQLAVTFVLFVGLAVPFKVMAIIPGVTELRPVNALPMVAGLLFGLPGALGCALGNLAADAFGTFSKASLYGFAGNFIAAYLPYSLWQIFGGGKPPQVKDAKHLTLFVGFSLLSALSVAQFLAIGIASLGLSFARQLYPVVAINNFTFTLVFGLPVFIVLTSGQFAQVISWEQIHLSRKRRRFQNWSCTFLIVMAGWGGWRIIRKSITCTEPLDLLVHSLFVVSLLLVLSGGSNPAGSHVV